MLEDLKQRQQKIAAVLKIDQEKSRLKELEKAAGQPDLWNDQNQAVRILSELESLKELFSKWNELEGLLSDEFWQYREITPADRADIEKELEELEKQALLSGEHDSQSAILTIHAGTGGVDAQDWTAMLERMYLRYIEQGATEQAEERTLSLDRTRWQANVIDQVRGEEAGIKKTVIEVQGKYAYGMLKAEAGVHRLVRLSPFNAKNLRQTSFALVEVIPEIEQTKAVIVDEKDLRFDVYRSGGHGGQGVNTTDSAVRVTHLPTGITVAVQNERSQHQNKATALKILQSRLNRLQEVQNSEETAMLKGEFREGSWGNQIRSYVMQPYRLVKDHRTEFETSDVEAVLDGRIGKFIENYLITFN